MLRLWCHAQFLELVLGYRPVTETQHFLLLHRAQHPGVVIGGRESFWRREKQAGSMRSQTDRRRGDLRSKQPSRVQRRIPPLLYHLGNYWFIAARPLTLCLRWCRRGRGRKRARRPRLPGPSRTCPWWGRPARSPCGPRPRHHPRAP